MLLLTFNVLHVLYLVLDIFQIDEIRIKRVICIHDIIICCLYSVNRNTYYVTTNSGTFPLYKRKVRISKKIIQIPTANLCVNWNSRKLFERKMVISELTFAK
jgi:hypothetical protein